MSRSKYTKPSGFPGASDNLFEGKSAIQFFCMFVCLCLYFYDICRSDCFYFDIRIVQILGIVPQTLWSLFFIF